jgi:tetratricopeptide (TPR) repeat protein
MEISEHFTGVKTKIHARLLVDLGRLETQRGNLEKAEDYLSRSLTLTRELDRTNNPEVAETLMDLASAKLWRDDYKGAEQVAREALGIYRTSVPELHPDRVMAEFRLGEALYSQGRMTDAAALFEHALGSQRVLFGQNSRIVADTLGALAVVRLAQDRIDDAHGLTEDAIKISKSLGDDSYLTGYLQSSFAQVLMREGRFDLAEKNAREALSLYAKSLPPDHQYIASAEYILGEVLLSTNRPRDAEAVLAASINRWKHTNSSAWRIARSASALGEAMHRQGKIAEAEKFLVDGYQGVTTDSFVDKNTKRKARERIERFYTDRGERRKLKELLLATGDRTPETTAQSN